MKRLKSIYKNEIEIKEISILKALMFMIMFTIIPFGANILFTVIVMIIDESMSIGSITILSGIVVTVSSVLTVILAGKLFTVKGSTKINNSRIRISRKDLMYVFLIVIGYIFIREGIIFDVLSGFEGPVSDEDINFLINNSTEIEVAMVMVIMWLQALIGAPIFEELLFRGIILMGLYKKYNNSPKKAIIVSSTIFAVVHLNIPQGINAFILGIILGGIYYYTKSMKLAIFAHFVNNFFVFIPSANNIILKITYVVFGIVLIFKGINYIKININNRKLVNEVSEVNSINIVDN